MMRIGRKKNLLAGITPRRILIVRLGAIGDVVFASTILAPLRRHFPQAHITWLVQKAPAALLAHHPCVDRLVIWPREEWLALWRARRLGELSRVMLAFVKRLRQDRFDMVLDLQGLLKSGLLAWSAGGKVRIGLGSREGSSFLMHHALPRCNPAPSFAGEYQHLLVALGIPPAEQLNSMVVDETECCEVAAWLQGLGVMDGYIALCPFTTRPQKHWKVEHWTTLIQTLAEHAAVPCLILGGPDDRSRGHAMAQAHDTCLSLAGLTTLRQAGAVLAGASLVIGVDTGLTHLAATLAVPTIALFGSTRPYTHVPGHARAVVLSRNLPCSPCRRHPTCAGAFPCMAELAPGQVLQTALGLLAA
jgi:heptosyltransferase-1